MISPNDWFNENYGDEQYPKLLSISGSSMLVHPEVTEERFFEWIDLTFGIDHCPTFYGSAQISYDVYEQLIPRFEARGMHVLP